MTSDAVLLATHCPRPEHAGPEGVFSHYCGTCKAMTCGRCGTDVHISAGHALDTVGAAAAAATEALRGGVDRVQAGAVRMGEVMQEIRDAQVQLERNRVSAEEVVRRKCEEAVARLEAARDALLVDVRRASDAKAAALAFELGVARSAVGELLTVGSAGAAALEGAEPVRKLHVLQSVEACMRYTVDHQRPITDPTLSVLEESGLVATHPLRHLCLCTTAGGGDGVVEHVKSDTIARKVGCLMYACHG